MRDDIKDYWIPAFAGMTVPNNITLGPVIPVDLTKENVGRVVDVPNAINITLTGTPVTNAQALATVPPFAPGPGEAPGNTYYFNSFNFNDLASTLIFQATSLFPPTGDNRIAFISGPGSIVTSVQGQADLTLQIDTDFQFKHPSWVKAKTFNSANNQLLNFVTDTSPAAGLYVNEVMDIQPIENSIKFGGQNATYDVSNESPNAEEFVASFNLIPANDVDGQLRVHVASGSREIALNADSGNGTGGTI
ncbi:hypothetical protein [Rickettsia conorii]|uniref:hypothetical protein n=1 Tax=Rickettsia conorii TaxID=781 RepID=UPI002B41317D|nr:hypothetical protein [Rickettsia conorii]